MCIDCQNGNHEPLEHNGLSYEETANRAGCRTSILASPPRRFAMATRWQRAVTNSLKRAKKLRWRRYPPWVTSGDHARADRSRVHPGEPTYRWTMRSSARAINGSRQPTSNSTGTWATEPDSLAVVQYGHFIPARDGTDQGLGVPIHPSGTNGIGPASRQLRTRPGA